MQQYSEGPQGDPFAPQATLAYFPIEAEPPPPPAKPIKRKRKARREEECGFCQGDDAKNKEGQPETMVTCTECGRSGEGLWIRLRLEIDHFGAHRPSKLYGAY